MTERLIKTRRGFPGVIINGDFLPLPIQGGDDYLDQINREADELYPTAARRIREAGQAARQNLSKLLRPDGQRLYGDQEHQERTQAVLARFDESVSETSSDLDDEIAKAERELVVLEAAEADPWDRLSTESQARAAARREFMKEDIASQSPEDLLRLARGALATKDPASLYLIGRYLPARIESMATGQTKADFIQLSWEISAALAVPQAAEKRSKATTRVERGKFLKGRPAMLRRELDGSNDQMVAGMRQRYSL